MLSEKNVMGGLLALHCTSPQTGFYRDGYCRTGEADVGTHVIAAIITDEFLKFTKSQGNDRQTPLPLYGFPGLKAGDRWCLCVLRWEQALQPGVAPSLVLESCHEKALEYVNLETLERYQQL